MGPRASCATSPRRAATCCSARAASTSRTSRSRATSARRAAAAPRARATTASWPSWAPRRRAQAVAGMEGRGGAARRAGDRGELPAGGRGRAGRRAAPAQQRLQGAARPQHHRAHAARPDGGGPPMTLSVERPPRAIGAPLDRIDGPLKVTGAAKYAYEYPVAGVTYVFPVQSTIAKGRIVSIDASAARALPGVLAALSHENAPRLHPVDIPVIGQRDQDLAVFQSDVVTYRGQVVAAVVAETLEVARQAASLVTVRYEEQPHDVELRADRGDLYAPETLVQGTETDTTQGDIAAALAAAPVSTDRTYTTPAEHNNPLEPHATVAVWDDGQSVTLYDANQGADWIRAEVAEAFGLTPEHVRVIAPYVGGRFGYKAFAHSHVILAVMAALVAARPAKLAFTRQQMFALTGYRSPTIQRIRLGAERDGRLIAIAHDVVAQTTTPFEFAEQAAVPTRMMYAAPNRRTTHRLARLDVPENTWMRGPGECPGMFALESAMDELAVACGPQPTHLPIPNQPTAHPQTPPPFSSRGLVACLGEG